MCWRCGNDEKYAAPDNNGMCFNCYATCKEALEKASHEKFEDGEPR